jgi:hypothetical protein
MMRDDDGVARRVAFRARSRMASLHFTGQSWCAQWSLACLGRPFAALVVSPLRSSILNPPAHAITNLTTPPNSRPAAPKASDRHFSCLRAAVRLFIQHSRFTLPLFLLQPASLALSRPLPDTHDLSGLRLYFFLHSFAPALFAA